jgi:hypothetical protein
VARSSTSCSALLAIALIAAVSQPAIADEPPWYRGVPKDTQAKATELFNRGNRLFEQSEYAKATEIYLQALALWDHPGIQFNLAVALMNLDRILDAHRHLTAALAFGPAGLDKRHQEALTYRRLLEGRLVMFTVETTQDGVEVALDGRPIQSGQGRVELTVLPGTHALVATKSGFETLTKNLTLVGGTPAVEKIVLAPRQRRTVVRRRYRTWVPWTIAGIGAGAALLGAGTITIARAHEREFEHAFELACPDGCTWGEPGKNVEWGLHDRAEIEHLVGLSVAGAGGALLVTGLVMVVLNLPREVEVTAPIVTSSAHHVGVVWTGTF